MAEDLLGDMDPMKIEEDPASRLSPSTLTPELFQMFMQLQSALPAGMQLRANSHGSWSSQEDEQLIHAITELKIKKWGDVAKCVPTRSSKQCRDRWFNHLAPELRHEPFERWEDEIILNRQKQIGNKWSTIAKELNGRSSSAVKNRWYSALKQIADTDLRQKSFIPLWGE